MGQLFKKVDTLIEEACHQDGQSALLQADRGGGFFSTGCQEKCFFSTGCQGICFFSTGSVENAFSLQGL